MRLEVDDLIALRQAALSAVDVPVLAALPGGFATRRKGHGQEVADVREYLTGDDIRHIDRGATARTGVLHIRQFQKERDRVCLLVADFRPSMLWGLTRAFRSVAAAEVLAMIGWRIVESGGRVGLMALHADEPVIVAPRGRSRGMLDVIGGMVRAHSAALSAQENAISDDSLLERCLPPLHRIAPSGSEIVIASGFDQVGDRFDDELDRLARRRTPRLIQITDAKVDCLPSGIYPIRLPSGRRVRVSVARSTPKDDEIFDEIAGRQALRIDAGATIDDTARRIATALPREQLQ